MQNCANKYNSIGEDEYFWNKKWLNNETGWDIGYASPAILGYMQQYRNKQAKILIPGCGNAYEAAHLAEMGFSDITIIDIAEAVVKSLKKKFNATPAINILHQDFFLHQGTYDLIIEQTFFCAISTSRREEYAKKVTSLLHKNGKLTGLMFNREFNLPHPPFGGNAAEYKQLFEPYFHLKVLSTCYNSIAPRQGTELFLVFEKK